MNVLSFLAVDVAAMEELDADDKRLSYQGRVADRDIVQVCCMLSCNLQSLVVTSMWANAQRDGRSAEYRWLTLFNAAKFG